jgi:formate--tetrahydrofolate ligase
MMLTKALLPIRAIAEKLGLLPEEYETIGAYGAKLKLGLLNNSLFPVRGKFILVTATTPTTSGEGKTVVSIGLAQGLEQIGRKAIVTSREPSLGPVFGLKGGAAGGGLSQVEPSQQINLHFHGDFHAITAAHNMLAALVDSHLFFGNALDLDPEQISWPRAMDMNDRALRRVEVGIGSKGDGVGRKTSFGDYGDSCPRFGSRGFAAQAGVDCGGRFACGQAGDGWRSGSDRGNDGAAE